MERLEPIPVIKDVKHPLADPTEPVSFRVDNVLTEAPEEGIDWNTVLDVFLFTALFVLGITALYFRDELKSAVFGEILVNSGITPIVLAVWALMLGSRLFRRQNAIKAVSAGIVFSLGYGILHWEGELDMFDFSSLIGLFGPALLELGFVFFIGKVFFLAEDAELQVERLEKDLDEARRSPGLGLALSYFYNFLLPTASNFVGLNTVIHIGQPSQQHTLTHGKRLFVFIPRHLNDTDIKVELRKMQTERLAFQGKPADKSPTHRPMFLLFLENDEEKKTCGFGFDVPTVIGSCWDRARFSENPEEAKERVVKEILDFQNSLQELVDKNETTRERVVLVSIPPSPFDARALLHIARKIDEEEK